MPPSEPDRRRAARRVPSSDEALSRMRLRTGRELAVVDISSMGALVEGSTRLLPGTNADVHVVTRHGRVLARVRVVRAWVWRLEPDAVRYRGALSFDTALDTEAGGYPVPVGASAARSDGGRLYPDRDAGRIAGTEHQLDTKQFRAYLQMASSLVADDDSR